MKTITEKWLAGKTFLDEVDGWEPGDRGPQYHAVPGHRCACGNIYRVGQKVNISHQMAVCDNCNSFMF